MFNDIPRFSGAICPNYTFQKGSFRKPSSHVLERVQQSGGDTQKWTIALWYSRQSDSIDFVQAGTTSISVNASGKLTLTIDTDTVVWDKVLVPIGDSVEAVIVVAVDTTQAVAEDRARAWFNNGLVANVLNYESGSITLNASGHVGESGVAISLTSNADHDIWDFSYVDGLQLDNVSFIDPITTVRGSYKEYIGSFGATGFKLRFLAQNNFGQDSSGLANDLTWIPEPGYCLTYNQGSSSIIFKNVTP